MLRPVGTYKGHLVYVETTPEGDRIPFYNRILRSFKHPQGKLTRIYITPEVIE